MPDDVSARCVRRLGVPSSSRAPRWVRPADAPRRSTSRDAAACQPRTARVPRPSRRPLPAPISRDLPRAIPPPPRPLTRPLRPLRRLDDVIRRVAKRQNDVWQWYETRVVNPPFHPCQKHVRSRSESGRSGATLDRPAPSASCPCMLRETHPELRCMRRRTPGLKLPGGTRHLGALAVRGRLYFVCVGGRGARATTA